MRPRAIRSILVFSLAMTMAGTLEAPSAKAQGCVYTSTSSRTSFEAASSCGATGTWHEATNRCKGIAFNC